MTFRSHRDRPKRDLFVLFLLLFLWSAAPDSVLHAQENHTKQEASTGNVDIILAIDLSKSMRGYGDAANIFSRVQETMKDVVRELEKEDTVTIIPFGSAARALTTVTIYGDTERQRLFERIDQLSANQSWTYTAEALRLSLQEASRLEETFPNHQQVVFILTDGRNNPPPGAPDGYDLNIQKLAKNPPTEPWYVYQVQYGGQVDQALDSLIAKSDFLKGGTIHDENAQGGIDTLRTKIYPPPSPGLSATPDSVSVELASPEDSATASVQLKTPEGIRSAALKVELYQSNLPDGLTLDYEAVSRPGNNAQLNITVSASRSIQNGQYGGIIRVSSASTDEKSRTAPLQIPLTIRTTMVPPVWPWWLGGIAGGLLLLGGGAFLYREWRRRQLFGTLEYWPNDDPDSGREKELDQYGMSATIGSDIYLSGEDELGRLSVEKKDGRYLVVVRPHSGIELKHEGRPVSSLSLYNRDTFELGDWSFQYTGATGRRPRR